MDYLPLETSFHKYGEDFIEVFRDGDFRVYQRKGNAMVGVSHEVIRVVRAEERQFNGKVYPPSEVYPTSSQWGNLGWTCMEGEEAAVALLRRKKAELEERESPTVFRSRVRK